MEKANRTVVTAILVFCSFTQGFAGNFGVGFMLGEPTGISSKLWLNQNNALAFALGWRYWGGYYDRGNCWYTDPRCNDNAFYNANRGYCNSCLECDPYGPGYRWRSVHLHVDYLRHNFSLIRSSERLAVYYGVGMLMNFGGDYYYNRVYHDYLVGARGPVGLTWLHRNSTFDIFFELAPALIVIPYIDFIINGSLGGRYYF